MKKAVIFDMDGVIVDSEAYNQVVLKNFFDEKTEFNSKDLHLTKFIGSAGEVSVWEKVFEDVKHDGIDFELMLKELYEYMDEYPVPYKDYVMENSEKVLEWLKSQNIKIGLASSSPKDCIDEMLHVTGFDKYFSYVLSGLDLPKTKPDPTLYLNMLELMQEDKKDCLIIEDSFYGIQAAINAGIDVVALKDNRFSSDQSNGKVFIDNLVEIIGLIIKDNFV